MDNPTIGCAASYELGKKAYRDGQFPDSRPASLSPYEEEIWQIGFDDEALEGSSELADEATFL